MGGPNGRHLHPSARRNAHQADWRGSRSCADLLEERAVHGAPSPSRRAVAALAVAVVILAVAVVVLAVAVVVQTIRLDNIICYYY